VAARIAVARDVGFQRVTTRTGASKSFVWWAALLSAICLEGLGRRYLPIQPAILYFAKDVILVFGIFAVGFHPVVARRGLRLGRTLPILVAATALWCVGSLLLPGHPSVLLGLLGTRQYLLWWIAPFLCASALVREGSTGRPERLLALLTLLICGLAAYQFGQPTDARVNSYVWDHESASAVAAVGSTGRVRVSSTFSYITGFADFVILMVPLLLACAVQRTPRLSSRLMFVAAALLAAAAPMSGSRATVLYVATSCLVVLGVSGTFRSRRGLAALAALLLAAGLGVWISPDATQGVQDRFSSSDTAQRFQEIALAFPIFTMMETEYPAMGAGVGVLQNAATAQQMETQWIAEAEPQRVLIELGIPGYLLVWLSRLALAVALIRAGRILSRAGERGWAGAAWTYVAFTFLLALTTDHVAQALFFIGVGFILARVMQVEEHNRASIVRR
jgi:hypothetical protein